MKSQWIAFILFSMILSACAPQVTSTSEVTVTLPPPTTLPVTATEIPFTALSPEEQVAKFLNGEITSISTLSLEQANAFRAALVEQLNALGGVHVVFDAGGSNPAYIDPETFSMRQLNDGRSKAEQSIEMFRAFRVDAEGFLVFNNSDGTEVKIAGSAGVDWNEVVTDPNSTSIDFPKTKPGNSGLPAAQWFLTLEGNPAYKRVVLLGKMIGKFFLKEFSGGTMVDTLPFYQIITDKAGTPLYARVFLAAPAVGTSYFEEGSNVQSESWGTELPENAGMLPLMAENGVYLIGIKTDQATITSLPKSSAGYEGVVSETVAGEVLLGTKTDQNNLLFILMRMLIKAQP